MFNNTILNINYILKLLKKNIIFNNCYIFTSDELISLINRSLTTFNEIQHFTSFTWEDTKFIEQFHDILVRIALYFIITKKDVYDYEFEELYTECRIIKDSI